LYFVVGKTVSTDGCPFTVTKYLQKTFAMSRTYQPHCNYTTFPALRLNLLICPAAVAIGVGDGAGEGAGDTCSPSPKFGTIYFSGNYYVKFGHFRAKIK